MRLQCNNYCAAKCLNVHNIMLSQLFRRTYLESAFYIIILAANSLTCIVCNQIGYKRNEHYIDTENLHGTNLTAAISVDTLSMCHCRIRSGVDNSSTYSINTFIARALGRFYRR